MMMNSKFNMALPFHQRERKSAELSKYMNEMEWLERSEGIFFLHPIHPNGDFFHFDSDNRHNNFDRSTKTSRRGRKLQLNSNGGNIALNSNAIGLSEGKNRDYWRILWLFVACDRCS
jgi:hypothetical protein